MLPVVVVVVVGAVVGGSGGGGAAAAHLLHEVRSLLPAATVRVATVRAKWRRSTHLDEVGGPRLERPAVVDVEVGREARAAQAERLRGSGAIAAPKGQWGNRGA